MKCRGAGEEGREGTLEVLDPLTPLLMSKLSTDPRKREGTTGMILSGQE